MRRSIMPLLPEALRIEPAELIGPAIFAVVVAIFYVLLGDISEEVIDA